MTVAISTEQINSYYGKAQALREVSIEVNEDETVGILGRNGAGKTTLIKSLIGYSPPHVRSGKIRLFEEDITGLEPYQIARRGVGYVPEEREVFPELTVDENLEVGKRGARREGEWTKQKVYETFTELDDIRQSKAESLSGGEQQMLTIGRTLMGNPSVLLLDEPTEGLAPQLVQTVQEQLEEIETGTTVVLAEQNTEVGLGLSDRVYVVAEGEIIMEGRPEEIRGTEEFEQRVAV